MELKYSLDMPDDEQYNFVLEMKAPNFENFWMMEEHTIEQRRNILKSLFIEHLMKILNVIDNNTDEEINNFFDVYQKQYLDRLHWTDK